MYFLCKYLFVCELSSQRPSINGVEGLLIYNSLYSMGLVFYAIERLLLVLNFVGKHLCASYNLHELVK